MSLRVDFKDFMESLQTGGKPFFVMALGMIVLMALICGAVFMLSVKGSEEVMVPNVEGKELTVALLDMQVKELYPKIQLRYSNSPDEKGRILEQSPKAGSIVKAGRRINLVVSRGVVIDKVENYIGQKFDDVKMNLQSLFVSSKALIVLQDPPLYKFDSSEAGTILEQDPLPETSITDTIKLNLVVSRGPEKEKVKVPELIGSSINDIYLQMNRTKVIYDFTSRSVESGERVGTIVSQLPESGSSLDMYSRVSAVLAYPQEQSGNTVYGIFTQDLPAYPYAIQLQVDALTTDGDRYTLVTFLHEGGTLSVPYMLPKGTTLILSILNKEALRYIVE